jgi:3-dehydrotetronate 4-kinase
VVKLQALWSIAWGFPDFSLVQKSLQACRFCAAVGAKNGEMLLALKSSNFGGPDFFSDALKLMR